MINEEIVRENLKKVIEQKSGKDVIALGIISSIVIKGIQDGKAMPIEKYGLHTISIGYFIDKDRAAIWRGPMITKALYNLLMGTKWSDIEYLIVDTPPGTSNY